MTPATMLPMFLLAIHQINYSEYLTSINQPIRELLTTSTFPDVLFIVHNPNKSEIIDDMYRTVAEISPTTFVYLNRSDTNLSFRVSRRTLILYVYISKSPPDVRQSEEIADIISRDEARQKVLLITILEESGCDFESVFQQMWRKMLLNVAILELPRFQENRAAIMVHRYNPYSKVYDRREYTPGIEWFPDKTSNLHGSTLRLLVFSRPSIVDVQTDLQGRVDRINGPDAKALEIFTRVLNFTPDVHNVVPANKTLQETILAHNIDMTMLSLPIFKPNASMIEYTLPLMVESWCPVVPINYTFKLIEMRAVIGVIINCVIVSVFWGISHVLKFDRRSWQPLKIFGTILSMSVSMKPRRVSEKILLLAIFLVSSFVSSNLYADLTTSSLRGESHTVYKNFEELGNSGLVPVVLKAVFNTTFSDNDPSFVALKKKAVTTLDSRWCIRDLAKYKNITCFMEKKYADMLIYSYTRKGKGGMIVCENLCYAKPRVGYLVKKNSPFVERITTIAIRLQTSGIRHKWNIDYIGKFSPRKTHLMHVKDREKSSLARKLIPIGLCGCFLSLLVFWAEIVLGRVENNEEE